MCGRKGIMFVEPLILLGPMLSFLQYSISLNLQNNLEGKALSPFYRRDSRDSGTLPTCLGVLELALCGVPFRAWLSLFTPTSASSRTAFLKEECTELWFLSR